MNKGDYVRTDDGYIAKYIGKNKDKYVLGKHYNFDGTIRDVKYAEVDSDNFLWEEELKYIIKSSPNIIDLIEVGDLLFIDISTDNCGGIVVPRIAETEEDLHYYLDELNNEAILKGIITKEQIESMVYKL